MTGQSGHLAGSVPAIRGLLQRRQCQVRRKLARLYARACNCSRTALALKLSQETASSYQPFHDSHRALIAEGMRRAGQVCIAVRDTGGTDAKNPFSFEYVPTGVEHALRELEGRVTIEPLPNVTHVSTRSHKPARHPRAGDEARHSGNEKGGRLLIINDRPHTLDDLLCLVFDRALVSDTHIASIGR
jgi:hypothetical protein